MSDVLTEPTNLGDVLQYEEENFFYSRDEATIAQGELIAIGQVLARDDASGEYVVLDPDGGEQPSTDVAAAIAIRAINATTEAVKTVVLVRHAIVKVDGLVWPAGITPDQQVTATVQLQAQGILIRR